MTAGRSQEEQDQRELQLAAEARSVRLARHAASEFAEKRGVDAEAVALAVSEVVTNAVVHAHRDGTGGEIVIDLKPNGEGIIITVADDGTGIRPNPDSPGLGYGLAVVASLADEVAIGRSDRGGTAVKMRFRPSD